MINFDSTYTKIENPFIDFPDYRCFACSPENKHGLHMEFFEKGDNLFCRWEPREHFQGYRNIIHGGIQATLADEIAGWFIIHKLKTAGLTKNLNVKYLSKIFTNKGDVYIKASLKEKQKKSAIVFVEISDSNDKLCTSAEVEFFILPDKVAEKKVFMKNNS